MTSALSYSLCPLSQMHWAHQDGLATLCQVLQRVLRLIHPEGAILVPAHEELVGYRGELIFLI